LDLVSDSELKAKNKLFNIKPYSPLKKITFSILLPLFFFTCGKDNRSLDNSQILAVIDTKTITVQDFIHRSEYTIRPPYCNGNTYIHKKIILNSLIGEKMLALESDSNDELEQNADYQAYIQGRKEQAMRQIHFYEEAYKKAIIEEEELKEGFEMAGRIYHVSYISVPDQTIVKEIEEELKKSGITLAQMYQILTGEKDVPKKEIRWSDPENSAIRDILFGQRPKKNEVIGPINVNNKKWLFLEVTGWIDQKIMSESAAIDRRQQVVDKLKNQKSLKIYKNYVGQLMQEKRMNFYASTFKKLVKIAAPIYLNSANNKKNLLNNHFWQEDTTSNNNSFLPNDLNAIGHLPLFSINGNIWTVDDFRALLKRHPLVFRDEIINNKNFPEQFKYALVDLIRDYYITKDAYGKGYDKSFAVTQQVEIWRDNMQAIYQKFKYLELNKIHEKNKLRIVEGYITPYINTLQQKYAHRIKINMDKFEELSLTKIDLVALQPDQAFPVVVPFFPLLTVDNRLDYGSVLQ